jgi:hypothetical protein
MAAGLPMAKAMTAAVSFAAHTSAPSINHLVPATHSWSCHESSDR